MEKDITAFIDECYAKGGFTIKSFTNAPTPTMTVVTGADEVEIIGASILDSFEELNEKFKLARINFYEKEVRRYSYALSFSKRRLEALKNENSTPAQTNKN